MERYRECIIRQAFGWEHCGTIMATKRFTRREEYPEYGGQDYERGMGQNVLEIYKSPVATRMGFVDGPRHVTDIRRYPSRDIQRGYKDVDERPAVVGLIPISSC